MKASNERRFNLLKTQWEREEVIMQNYCAKHKSKNKKLKALNRKIQSLDPKIRDKMIAYHLQKKIHEHKARIYEWIKFRREKEEKEFFSEEAMENRISDVTNMNKFIYKGVDNAILDSEYKKEKKKEEK